MTRGFFNRANQLCTLLPVFIGRVGQRLAAQEREG
jgi:hypothetical protein